MLPTVHRKMLTWTEIIPALSRNVFLPVGHLYRGFMFSWAYVLYSSRDGAAWGSIAGCCDSFVSLVETVSGRLAGRRSWLISAHWNHLTFVYCCCLSSVICVTFDIRHDGNMTARSTMTNLISVIFFFSLFLILCSSSSVFLFFFFLFFLSLFCLFRQIYSAYEVE